MFSSAIRVLHMNKYGDISKTKMNVMYVHSEGNGN